MLRREKELILFQLQEGWKRRGLESEVEGDLLQGRSLLDVKALLFAEGEHGLKKVARYPHPMVREQAIGGVKPPLVALVILDEQLLPTLR